MTVKIATKTVIVHRKGASVSAPIGEPFDFTDEEIQSLEDIGCGHFLRDPVNEAPAPEPKGNGKKSATEAL